VGNQISSLTAEENVIIRRGECAVTLLPQFGGKIASIAVNGKELLQAPLAPYAPRTATMSFDAGDASGWDECLPSVAECTVDVGSGLAWVPDHGDLWRVEWTENQGSGIRGQGAADTGSVTLRGECFSLPLTLERILTFSETAKGCKLQQDYTLTNTGDETVPWSWSAHPLFVAEAGDRIVLPESIDHLRLEGSGGGRLGAADAIVSWPMATLADGGQTDLSVFPAPDAGFGDKLFAGPLREAENWCALERPSAGVRIRVSFDSAATPYLGLWICSGGWPEKPGPKQVCVALEPATAPVDSLAVSGPWSRTLKAGESYFWQMTVDIESI
jgi:galactose mutarotase-like enzyme